MREDFPVVRRDCGRGRDCTMRAHTWEWLNPATMLPFRRGRVVFRCGSRPGGRGRRG